MKNPINYRTCCVCEQQLVGRADKVFCDIRCKNAYHSQLRKSNKLNTTETVRLLHKNYQILCYLKGTKVNKFEISKLELERLGFSFDIVTGFEINKFGIKTNLFEFSWYTTKHRKIIVSLNPDENRIAPFLYRRWQIHYQHFQQ